MLSMGKTSMMQIPVLGTATAVLFVLIPAPQAYIAHFVLPFSHTFTFSIAQSKLNS
jgi:hypothetical protein